MQAPHLGLISVVELLLRRRRPFGDGGVSFRCTLTEMRRTDLVQLEAPYPLDPSGHPVSDLGSALGLPLATLRQLTETVFQDLDAKRFGIGWWQVPNETQLQLQQRILISDYLIDALQGVESHLVDVRLHFLELQDAWDQEGELIKGAIQVGPDNRPFVKMPPRLRPVDDLPHHLVDLHTGGVFRAIGSALDCLASVAPVVQDVIPVTRDRSVLQVTS